jgi:4-hydroxybenzoate polyprenyltransferase
MKKFTQWVLAFRPVSTIFAGLLVNDSFILAGKATDWTLVILSAIASSTTMLQNDYFDRFNDRRKGKDLAYNNPKMFVTILILLWTVLIFSTAYYFYYREEIGQGIILTICMVIGFFYSRSRTVEYLPIFLVAVASSSIALFVLDSRDTNTLISIVLSATVFFIIIGSEILKDIEDSETDIDYKVTLLTSGLSKRNAVRWSAVFISISLFFCLPVMEEVRDMPGEHMLIPALTFGFGFFGCCATIIDILSFKEEAIKRKQRILDAGLALMLIAIALIPYCK